MRLTFHRLLFTLLVFSTTASAQVTSYKNLWSEIYRDELKSLTASALVKVDSLYAKAKREDNMTQITLALLYQSKFTMVLKENSELAVVKRFEQEISNSKAPLRNILESCLAELYNDYFIRHQYVYEKRSRTAENVNPADFRTWDEDGMFREIRRHYQNSLRDASVLQTTKLEKINGLLLPAEDSRLYRPSLYDLLAHRALDYYTHKIILKNSDNTTHASNSFAWDDPTHFKLFAIPSIAQVDSLSLPALAFNIYRDLFNFHRHAFDTSALVNLEMERLDFIKNASGTPHVLHERHKDALQKLKGVFIKHPSSAAVAFKIATMLKDEADRPQAFQNLYYESLRTKKLAALELCQWAIDRFADSPGGKKCVELKEHLLALKLKLKVETFIPANTWSKVLVDYANVDRVSFSILRIKKGFERSIAEQSDSIVRTMLSGISPEHRWVSELKNPHDLLRHNTEVVIPQLAKGTYMIVAKVYNATDSTIESILAYKSICVTNLVLINSESKNTNRYQVIDRTNGKPIHGATVQYTELKNDETLYTTQQTTDKDGFIKLKDRDTGAVRFLFTASYNGDTIVVENYRYYRYFENADKNDKKEEEEEEEEVTANTQMFTDRAIYRPGQKIYFKGILFQHKNQKTSVVSGKHVHVILEDPSGVEVNTIRLKTNSFGSFSGSFVLPSSGLTGTYSLYAYEDAESDSTFFEDLDNFNYNSLEFSVEEYKRPTFETKFSPVHETFVLNDSIHVKGTAKSYSGSALKGAVVNYRIRRTIAFSYWFSLPRRYLEGGMDAQEITSGQITTDAKGEFTIPFKAASGDTIHKEERPVFSYSITADVTDINGETRSTETTVNVGYHVLDMSVKMDHTLDRRVPNIIRVVTENLNEQFTPAKGTLALYKLKTPSQPQRHRPWSAPDLPILSEEAFTSFFPYESYDEKNRTLAGQKGELLALLNFDTRISKDVMVTMNKTWPLGEYIVELNAIDAAGLEVVALHQFQLHDPTSKTVADQAPLVLTFDKKAYAPGEVAHLKVGSACSDLTVTVFIEKLQKINRITVEHLTGSTKDIAIPITENMGNEFSVTATTSYQNSLHTSTIRALVARPSKNIEIETVTFKDKLQPGAKETWSFEVKGPNGTQVEAEMLASMYDASLDQFNKNRWYYDFLTDDERYHHSLAINGDESFDVDDFNVTTDEPVYYSEPAERYDNLYWFGFTFTGMQDQSSYLDRIYPVGMTLNSPSIVSLHRGQSKRKGYVQGTVVDSNGQPLPGVNVTISNTTAGTITDANGHYEVKAGHGNVIRFTFVGYAPAETKLGRKTTVNVTLKEAFLALSEVVVTARGSYEKKALTQSITTLYRVDYGQLFFANQAGDVSISSFNFTPGGAPTWANAQGSFYVVDGVVVTAREIEGLDIADMQLLKGEAATSLYGARAANGVVVIVTRAGQQKIDEEMAKINVRKNFDETAFFFPHLTTDENGKVRFSFTTPEALTRWKLQLLAHTRNLTATLQTLQVITQKELMITPNLPRFLRTGDEVVLSTKIVNLTGQPKSGKAILQLTDAVTGKLLDVPFKNVVRALPFTVGAKSTTEVSWRLQVPEQVDAVQYKIVAKAGNFSDGEHNILPVIPNRILVTESLPMHAQSGETKHFALDKLRNTTSSTRQHHRLTLEVTSNPAWYAIQSLPYLMEFPYECAEQLFARYYANALASHIANSNPKIKAVFEKWSSSGELVSALEKNPELKSIVLEETPWVRSAQNETEQKKRLGSLFDLHALGAQQSGVLDKLKDMQLASGGFPWFNGGTHENRYITQHILAGLGHLKHLNVLPSKGKSQEILQGALRYLDAEMLDDYRRLLKRARANKSQEAVATFMDRQRPDELAIHYLYMRSFFPEEKMNDSLQVATAYFLTQSATYWSRTSLLLKGMTALIHFRHGNKTLSNEILTALKENSLSSDALGMYWRENTSGWHWYESPIETQALLIEAFSEVQENDATLDNLRVWLINHKQTHQWATTKSTTEAIYAILLHGSDWLPLEDQLETTVGTKKIQSAAKEPEAGTGYFSTSWAADDVTPELGEVTLTKKGNGIAWANLHWQYWEDLDKITWAESSLKLFKKVFAVSLSDKGELLTEVKPNTPVNVGDLLRVRIELHADRDLEFLHMKDLRASGVEPVDVHSFYKYQSGIDYYQSTRDASTNFFFDNLPKGVYIFEYDLRVNNRGNFSNGITTIQSMYAPEFGSHSNGTRMTVK